MTQVDDRTHPFFTYTIDVRDTELPNIKNTIHLRDTPAIQGPPLLYYPIMHWDIRHINRVDFLMKGSQEKIKKLMTEV